VLSVLKRAAVALGGVLLVALVAWIAWLWNESRLPGTYNVMNYGVADYGGGQVPPGGHDQHVSGGVSVADLHGPAGRPDRRFTLVAKEVSIRLPSGRTVDALTFNGQVPGPELRVRRGDLVEVTLVNENVPAGVTIHWHGVDVPNAEDGVAGVTQNAVLPGQRFTYRFRTDQEGTFWYHTHQISSKEVRRGLFGALVIEPRGPAPRDTLDLALVAHTFDNIVTLAGNDGLAQRAVRSGVPVRLRLVNSDNSPQRFTLGATPFRVLALDGVDLNDPTPISNEELEVAAGGRADVGFTMPAAPVRLSIENTQVGLVLSTNGSATPPAASPEQAFDPTTYGHPTRTPFGLASHFDRHFTLSIGRRPAFLDGRPGLQWSIDGHVYPHVPTFVVEKGDLVELTISNHTHAIHPMHLHGHHVLVLSRDGKPVSGSPWWPDTLDVKPGETYVVGFRADNPGLWMDHCHNLGHAAAGLTMHLVYLDVTTPFNVGDVAHNRPE
jgi:FtsP/CotA-like multicopper oxidase with cupredoxin domain